jgi:CIC family chloride channel protein
MTQPSLTNRRGHEEGVFEYLPLRREGLIEREVVSSITVRELFGYSFTTWRLHLRGETIRSAHDVGRIRALTVGSLMRRDVRTVLADTRISAFRRDFPLGSTQRVVVVDGAGRYQGIALVAEVHAPELDSEGDLRRRKDRRKGCNLYPHVP